MTRAAKGVRIKPKLCKRCGEEFQNPGLAAHDICPGANEPSALAALRRAYESVATECIGEPTARTLELHESFRMLYAAAEEAIVWMNENPAELERLS